MGLTHFLFFERKVIFLETGNQFLGTERVSKLMRQYAIPCIISLLVGALYNIVDQIFIANASYLGSYGNAANTVVFPLTVVALAIAVMIGDGCCTFVSISLGKGQREDARRAVGNAVVLAAGSGLVLTALYLLLADQILAMFGGTVNAETILTAGVPKLQGLGMTFRKAEYITDFAEKVHTGAFDLHAVEHMSDEDAIRELSSLKGIGVWTAEMILLFCMQRPDIFSYDDLAIQRGLRMVYHHRSIDRRLFEKYRRRFHPYCSVASLYLWAVAGGAIPEMKDYKPSNKNRGSF